jgi:hypothetical protein
MQLGLLYLKRDEFLCSEELQLLKVNHTWTAVVCWSLGKINWNKWQDNDHCSYTEQNKCTTTITLIHREPYPSSSFFFPIEKNRFGYLRMKCWQSSQCSTFLQKLTYSLYYDIELMFKTVPLIQSMCWNFHPWQHTHGSQDFWHF